MLIKTNPFCQTMIKLLDGGRWRVSLLILLMMFAHLPIGSAQARVVNVNTADRAQLESLPGLGPAKVELILTERNKALFASPADLSNRVKGLSMKSVEKLLSAGLIVAPIQSSQK